MILYLELLETHPISNINTKLVLTVIYVCIFLCSFKINSQRSFDDKPPIYFKSGIEPVVGKWKRNRITNGVGEVELNMNIKGVDSGIVESEMLLAAHRKYGIYNRKRKGELDLIMLCLPEGTSGTWWAYAYPNHWISVYNDNICLSLSAQMHEVGHNLGLAHSGEDLTYDDMSGYMDYSVADQDGPFKCFNGAKSWQLGWYFDGHESIMSMPVNGKREYEGRLIGAAEYKKLELSSDRVIVQINGHQSDYYVSFNAQKGINSGTDEGGDEVLVHSRITESQCLLPS